MHEISIWKVYFLSDDPFPLTGRSRMTRTNFVYWASQNIFVLREGRNKHLFCLDTRQSDFVAVTLPYVPHAVTK